MALNSFCERSCFVKGELVINKKLLNWIFGVIEDMIKSTMEDNPDKISTFIAVNEMIEQLEFDISTEDMNNLIGETLTNKIFDEIKNSI